MNTNSISLSLNYIREEVNDFFLNELSRRTETNGLDVKKTWIYDNRCTVVDFKFEKLHFAFNIFPSSQERVKVDLLQRQSSTTFRLSDTLGTHTCIIDGEPLKKALDKILETCIVVIEKKKANVSGNKHTSPRLNIGILTLPMNKNYGGNLQAYALQEVISKLGHNAIFVNRRFHHAQAKSSPNPYSNTVGLSPSVANKVFLDKYFRTVTKPFFSSEELGNELERYNFDALVVGSDQVWRPKYANALLQDFFLKFVPEKSSIRKISYAASFGSDKWEYDEKDQNMASECLRSFDAIGVREDQAVEMCKDHFNVASTHVLDPTMLLSASHYADKFSLSRLRVDDDYLLNYVLDLNDDKENIIKNLSYQLGLEAHSVNGRPFERINALNSVDGDLSVEGWLASFFKAKFIVTDSFHGVAFSILFNKPFLAYANPERGMARFTSLLKMFDLNSRLVVTSSQVTKQSMTADIDWSHVNSKLHDMRGFSIRFFLKALGLPDQPTSSLKRIKDISFDIEKSQSDASPLNERQFIERFESNTAQKITIREFPSKSEKKNFNIDDVIASNMCIGCGACSYATGGKMNVYADELGGESVTTAEFKSLSKKEIDQANKVCPFSDESANEDELDAPNVNSQLLPFNDVIGRYSSIFTGRQIEDVKLMGSSSGGLTSWLVKKLLAKGMIDGVVHVGKALANDTLFEYRISTTQDELDANRKSNYYPTTLTGVLNKIKEVPHKKYAIVGVPCFIKAARLLSTQDDNLNNSLKYFVGIVCGHMKSKFFAESNAWQLGVAPNEIESVDFRKKIPNKKVGNYHFSVTSKDNKEVSAQPNTLLGGNWGHAFFQPNACNYCDDIFAETADIVFGDAWLPKFNDEWRGTNIVVSRNPELTQLFEEAYSNNDLNIDNLSLEEVIQTQFGGISHRRHGLAVRIKDDADNNLNYPSKRVNPNNINLPFWRVELLKQRRKMSSLSSKIFAEAKKANDLEHFMFKMTSEVAIYGYIESLKKKKTW